MNMDMIIETVKQMFASIVYYGAVSVFTLLSLLAVCVAGLLCYKICCLNSLDYGISTKILSVVVLIVVPAGFSAPLWISRIL